MSETIQQSHAADLAAMTSEALVQLAQAGRHDAEAVLIVRELGRTCGLIARWGRRQGLGREDIQDAQQQASACWLKEAIADFDPRRRRHGSAGRFGPFSLRVLWASFQNHCRGLWRYEAHQDRRAPAGDVLERDGTLRSGTTPRVAAAPPGEPDPGAAAAAREQAARVRQVFDSLGEVDQALWQGIASRLTLDEMARACGLSVSTLGRRWRELKPLLTARLSVW